MTSPRFCLLLLPVAALLSCAPRAVHDSFGTELQQGRVHPSGVPESLTVDLDVHVAQKGAPPFSARLYAQPHRRYRLDVFGFGSRIAASYFWDRGTWTLLLNERGERWRGAGDSLSLDVEGVSLHLPNVHALFGFLWSEPLPGFSDRDDSALVWNGDTLSWRLHGASWKARFESSTGVCLEARSETLLLRYGPYQRFGDRVAPGEAEVWMDGEPRISLRVKKIQDHPVWKKDPFIPPVPRKQGIRE